LLAILLKEQGAGPHRAAIPVLPRDRPSYPLSFAQERLWVIDQLEPGNVTYNLPLALLLVGRLDFALLARTLTEVVRRHQVLRTTYGAEAGQPVQIVAPPAPLAIPLVDLSALPLAQRGALIKRLTAEEAVRPFDLTRSVMRICLVRASAAGEPDEQHALLLTFHHIASDGWSNGVLVREVMALYEAFAKGLPSPLPELPIQYVDFAAWQRRTHGGDVHAGSLAFWRQQLEGVPVLDLPTDRPRPPLQGLLGDLADVDPLSEAVSEELRTIARNEGGTLFMLVTAAFHALLARITGQTDIAVGTPVANRHRTETEELIGFFVNTLVLRADLSGDPTLRELLGRVRRVAMNAFAHQNVPFSQVVEVVKPERSLAHTPLFQVACSLGNLRSADLEIPGFALHVLEAPQRTAKFDLTLTMADNERRVGGTIEFRTDLFDKTTVMRFAGHYTALLESVGRDLDVPLSRLSFLPASERHQLTAEWSDGGTAPPCEGTLHERFAAQAARTPDAPALAEGPRHEVTFRELNARANRLAHHLIRLGVGPEARVGLCVPRGGARIVALLAVLKAGGAYVPLDPEHPAERLARLAEDSGLTLALVAAESSTLDLGVPLLAVERATGALSGIAPRLGDDANPPPRVSPDGLAYVLYTSGSTGVPKGVEVPHRGVVSALRELAAATGLGPGDRFLQWASHAFDASVLEIFTALPAGACLCLPASDAPPVGADLGAEIERYAVTAILLPPSVVQTLSAEAGRTLRVLLVGSEKCPADVVRRWAPGRGLWNLYGPTEGSIFSTAWEAPADGSVPEVPPVGRPIAGTRVHVLDAGGEPAPIGVPGELLLGGVAPARGYLARPEKTAETFVPDPFADTPGARLYKTGDLGRFRAAGTLEVLGRADHQVKVRGVRIEPGEIEAVLATHPAVVQAAVVLRDGRLPPGAGGGPVLAACVVLAASPPPLAELRGYLQARLPEAMVPGAWAVFAALPLLASGKVDRRALAESREVRDATGVRAAAAGVPPRNETEARLAAIWSELLGVAEVGVHDNFFELGGHSLLATQLVARVRESFQSELPQRALFEAPTVAELALRLAPEADAVAAARPIPRRAEGEPPVLSFAQERLWVLAQIEGASGAYNLPFALRLIGALDLPVLAATLGKVVRRHATLRT
ncbi:MAG TPA: amino acid adenylation domain-containing protein, partial [Thermoanaerobaculia bacterium]